MIKKLLFLLLLVCAGLVFAWIKVPLVHTMLIRSTPTIAISEPLSIEGRASVNVTVKDEKGKIDKVRVSAIEGEKQKVLLETDLTPPESEHVFSVPLPGSADGFADGKASIHAEAFDSGFWKTKAEGAQDILIDTRPPRIEVLSLQHVVATGGAELVLLRAKDENLSGVSVLVNELEFPAFKLTEFDSFFADKPDLYGVLFALPMDFDPDHGKIVAVAADSAGNQRKLPLTFRIERARKMDVNPKLSLDFLHRKLPDLLPEYGTMANQPVPTETQIDSEPNAELIANFKLINERFRGMLAEKLKGFLYGKITPKRWDGDFIKPIASATTSIFGEHRQYVLDGQDAGVSIHYGLDLASVANDSVKATNNGTVVYSGTFGIYGQAVLLDHGLGISSLYGHLSSLTVQAGDTVKRGDEVGRTGQTGLAGGDHLHFEYRVNDVPVTPIELWDPKWIRDHITGKVEGLKTSLQAGTEQKELQKETNAVK